MKPALVKGRALKPTFGMSMPALVSRPIFNRSRRVNLAAINSRLFLAASSRSLSFFLFLFEMFAIGIFSL
jgi:hypothetical protein